MLDPVPAVLDTLLGFRLFVKGLKQTSRRPGLSERVASAWRPRSRRKQPQRRVVMMVVKGKRQWMSSSGTQLNLRVRLTFGRLMNSESLVG